MIELHTVNRKHEDCVMVFDMLILNGIQEVQTILDIAKLSEEMVLLNCLHGQLIACSMIFHCHRPVNCLPYHLELWSQRDCMKLLARALQSWF